MNMAIPDFSKAKVLVIGDIMLDRYWQGHTSRISPEAPVPIVKIQTVQENIGGAGNVALNVSALGAEVTLLGILGQDKENKKIQELLASKKIHFDFIAAHNIPTITKLRVLSHHQQLIRLDFEEPGLASESAALTQLYEKYVNRYDLVILSDYGKGTLSNAQQLIKRARQSGIPVFIDPKGHDFTIYRHANLLTPNLKEFENIVGMCPDESILEAKARELILSLSLDGLLITRGEQGMTWIEKEKTAFHLPTQAKEVFDVTGAGDTVIAVLAAAVAAGQPVKQAIAFANLAAGLVVSKLGAATVSLEELTRAHSLKPSSFHPIIMTDAELYAWRQVVRNHQETVVMTNGCFDLLHAGHIRYLKEAKALGDYLVVAINDDSSVARLKGKDRPIVPLAERMEVLAELKMVDYVVPFSEDTPERLIKNILPDILVKGGDYSIKQIAGSQSVIEAGGQVHVLSYKLGSSTSGLIQKIKSCPFI